MSLSRRKFLTLAGGGTVLAATAATAGFVTTRTPQSALAPWAMAGQYGDTRLNALSYALLAPNPHNRQPWIAALDGDDTVVLTRDPARDLPATDPHDRQITIGMGCFLELMVQAAAEAGDTVALDLFPEGDRPGAPIAVARFAPGATPDPLFAAVIDRRSCKEPFEMARPVRDAALADALAALQAPTQVRAAGTVDEARVAPLRALIQEAFEIEMFTPHTLAESIDLLRVGRAEIEANPDGIDLQDPFLEVLRRTGLLTREALLDTESQGFNGTLEAYRTTFANTPAFVWLTTPGNDRIAQIDAGRAWVRLNLRTTLMGLSLHPVSQALQEYPEMAEPYARAHRLLAEPGETVQMLGRLGYGPAVPRTPRWQLESRMAHA